jgi:hypothetical protein
MSNVAVTPKSGNAKVGPILVTTSSRSTCPPSCALIGHYDDDGKWVVGPCYADSGFHTRLHWNKVSSGERGKAYPEFLSIIAGLKDGQLWRHNVAGDLQGADDKLDIHALRDLTTANTGKRGFTYCHYPIVDAHNRNAIADANNNGFTVNVSCNTPEDAVEIRAAYKLPTVTLVPLDFWDNGDRVGNILRCPAETSDTITCKTCKLCAVSTRKDIVGFSAHGMQAAAADIIARAA